MPPEDDPPVALTQAELQRLREGLSAHGVDLAVVFGSTANPEAAPADVDVAVEFADYRPTDDGYAEVYLSLYSALEDELDRDVDLVDLHSAPVGFASAIFADGVLVLGSSGRLAELEDDLAGDEPTVEDARERVAAAVDRLTDA